MKLQERELLLLYLIFDLVLLNLSIILTGYLVYHCCFADYQELSIDLLHANLAWVVTYFVFSKKNLYLRDDFSNRIKRIFTRVSIFVGVSALIAYLFLPMLKPTFLIQYTLLYLALELIFYWSLYTYLRALRDRGIHTNKVLIVGLNDTGRLLRSVLHSNRMLGYDFVGYVSKHEDADPEVVGTPDMLADLIRTHEIKMVFVTLSLLSHSNQGKDYLKVCNSMGVRLRFVPENQSWFRTRVNMESVGDFVLINPQEIPLDSLDARILKRSFDILFSLLAIVFVFSWLFPIITLIIKLTSRGPVFFVQPRTGINNVTFNCFKFRSMRMNNDANSRQATANDDRITPIGKFMRKTNIDELPQFLNVFFGQMSIVGPRPHMLKHTEEYSKLIDYYMARHYVKPGVTGWAQVNGYRGETNELWKMEKRVEFDMDYIENWNFWWDLRIIFLTTFGTSAYKNAG